MADDKKHDIDATLVRQLADILNDTDLTEVVDAATDRMDSCEDDQEGTKVTQIADQHSKALDVVAWRVRTEVDVRGCADEFEAAERVARFLAANPGTGLVWGGAWDANQWGGRQPHRRTLDVVTGPRPVVLASADYHSLWANSAALRLVGYGPETTDPAGGRLVQSPSGAVARIAAP